MIIGEKQLLYAVASCLSSNTKYSPSELSSNKRQCKLIDSKQYTDKIWIFSTGCYLKMINLSYIMDRFQIMIVSSNILRPFMSS